MKVNIDRLTDSPYLNEEKVHKYIKLCKHMFMGREAHPGKEEAKKLNPRWQASQLVSLMNSEKLNRPLYVPASFVEDVVKNLEAFEDHTLSFLYYKLQGTISYTEFENYAPIQKLQELINVSNTDQLQYLLDYKKDRDIVKLIENIYELKYDNLLNKVWGKAS